MELFLTLLAILILAPMVLGPFIVKAGQWVSANFTISEVSVESLDPAVRSFLDAAKDEFESIGFEFIGNHTMPDYMPNMTTFFALFVEPQGRTMAMAAVVKHKSGRTAAYYEFTSKYANGRVINVSNSPTMGSFRNPDKSTYRYPKIRSARRLYDIHQWIADRDKKAVDPVSYEKDRAVELVAEAVKNELRLQEQFGYFHLGEGRGRGRYLFTWKGAFVMTEKNVFPIKNVLAALDLSAAQKAIAGMRTDAGGVAARRGEKGPALDAGFKNEQHVKGGAGWFYLVAALTAINSIGMKAGFSREFVVGLGMTRIVDVIAMMEPVVTSGAMMFHAFIIALDVAFAALFAAFGYSAQKGSTDAYEVGIFFYALDSLIFLATFDVIGVVLHGVVLFFLYRGFRALKQTQKSQAQPSETAASINADSAG